MAAVWGEAGPVEPTDMPVSKTMGTPSSAHEKRLLDADRVEDQRRRRHGEAGEAAGAAAGLGHLDLFAHRVAAARAGDDDRFARVGEHGLELDQLDDLLRGVFG